MYVEAAEGVANEQARDYNLHWHGKGLVKQEPTQHLLVCRRLWSLVAKPRFVIQLSEGVPTATTILWRMEKVAPDTLPFAKSKPADTTVLWRMEKVELSELNRR